MFSQKQKAHALFFLSFVFCITGIFLVNCSLQSSSTQNEWQEYRDERFGYGIMVPTEWEIDPPPAAGQASTLSVCNFDSSDIIQTGLADEEWPGGALKIDFVVIEAIQPGRQLWDIISNHFMDEPYVLDSITDGMAIGSGQAYEISFVDTNDATNRISALGAWLSEEKIIVAYVYPENAWENSVVQEILKSLVVSKKERAIKPSMAPPSAIQSMMMNEAVIKKTRTIVASRDIGDEVGDSPISPLYMPFSEGTSWIVGGVGSYYGEGCHRNNYNDYYATDWNMGKDGRYEYDYGQPLYPVAPGKVISIRYHKSNIYGGYGNYVKIQHEQGVTTLYGHMASVYVQQYQDVTIHTQLGTLGSTGNSTGPHLHLSFWVNGVSKYATPPSRRPSPMWTTTGFWKLYNGGSATVSKGNVPEPTPVLPTAPPIITDAPTSISTAPPVNTDAPTSAPTNPPVQVVLDPLRISNPGSGIYAGLKITHCIENGLQRVWIVNSSLTIADFVGFETQNGWCGNSSALRFHTSSNVASGIWITWCSGYAQGEEYVWLTDGSTYAPFQYPQYNGSCTAYQR